MTAGVTVNQIGRVAVVEITGDDNGHLDIVLVRELVAAFKAVDADPAFRVSVLASAGKHFCAGVNLAAPDKLAGEDAGPKALYREATKLFGKRKPSVAAVRGAAVGGGLGLALTADFRVASPDTRFVANFALIGIHPGFGLTHTLPRLIGAQRASLMFYTGRRITGEQAVQWGLADVFADDGDVMAHALRLAEEIARSAPLAVQAIRATGQRGLADAIASQLDHESGEQARLGQTADFAEGVKAVIERRAGNFTGS